MTHRLIKPIALAALTLALALPATHVSAQSAGTDLTTVSERSGFVRTGRYDEVIALCDAFAKAYPKQVRCGTFGTTPEGRPMKLLVVTRTGAFTPQQAVAKKLPVTLVQGGIHAGEIDGKDAGFRLLRELLEGRANASVLDRQVWLFVPVFNVDGHERFGAWNRPNQRGPEEMGWRATAQNYNLNRDYVKADAPEMQAMLGLVNAWDPLVYVDLHVTNGAKFQHDISVELEPLHAGDEALRVAGKSLRDGVVQQLAAQGSKPLVFYPSFIESDNPASGIADSSYPPRFSNGYFQLRNRFGVLVETHSWKDYPTRVGITRNTILAILEQVAAHGPAWQTTAHDADARARQLAGTEVVLDYRTSDKTRTVDFLGYAYTRTPSDVSGALMTRYDETKPEVWKIPLQYDVVPDHVATAPKAGYLIPAAYADAVESKLRVHGLEYRRLSQPLPARAVHAWRASESKLSPTSTEGHQRLTAKGDWHAESQAFVGGALYVPIAQPRARLVMALLEPDAPDSLLQWGRFNNNFEQKEYMDAYVAEEVAREMMAKDPALKAEFDKRVRDDKAFAASPQARLGFFHQRHASWDTQLRRYPVVRVDQAPPR